MPHSKHNTHYQSHFIERTGHFIHGYSTRVMGDMRQAQKRKLFLTSLGLAGYTLVMSEQVHGNQIAVVNQKSSSEVVQVDGLVLEASSRGIAIGILTADCVPILLISRTGSNASAIHAGWKGSYNHIVATAIAQMNQLGTKTEDIIACIGPYIGMCCYSVSEERARLFMNEYGEDEKIARLTDGTWYIDIGYANRLQLISAGVPVSQIEELSLCTSCRNDEFYSYRKDTKETFGEMMTVVSYKSIL